jgi:hypothetical protein
MKPREHVIWEIILVLASVMVFRSLWMLMDRVAWMSGTGALIIMVLAGLVLAVAAIYKLTHDKK